MSVVLTKFLESDGSSYYLKFRLYPFMLLFTTIKFEDLNLEIITDSYYDNTEYSFGSSDHYFRKRVVRSQDATVLSVKFVVKHPIHDSSPYYTEEEKDEEYFITNTNYPTSFLEYCFTRQYSTTGSENMEAMNDTEIYLDTIVNSDIQYKVISVQKKLSFVPLEATFAEVLAIERCLYATLLGVGESYDETKDRAHILDTGLPRYLTFSKFMYMLQLSPNYKLYDEIFADVNPVTESVDESVRIALLEKDPKKRLELKEYIWIVDYQPALFDDLIEHLEYKRCIEIIKERREKYLNDDSVTLTSSADFNF